MKFKLISEALILSSALSAAVYDLDNNDELERLEAEGLQFSRYGEEENLKIASSNGTTGFSWLVDRGDCRNILDITNGFVFSPSSGGSDIDFDSSFGEEIFTLTAIGEGRCTFRIAYANPEDRSFSFDEYERQNGLVIQIPIIVGSDANSQGSGEIGCDETRENCALKSEYGITRKVEKHFNLVGYQAWIRAFTTAGGPFVWLPQAIMYTRAKNGSVSAAQNFVWTTEWWAQIVGWIFFPVSIAATTFAVYPDLVDIIRYGEVQHHRLLSPKVEVHDYGHCNWWNTYCLNYHSDDHLSETIAAGAVIMSFEIAGWSMFYTGYKDALKYGKYLIEANAERISADAAF